MDDGVPGQKVGVLPTLSIEVRPRRERRGHAARRNGSHPGGGGCRASDILPELLARGQSAVRALRQPDGALRRQLAPIIEHLALQVDDPTAGVEAVHDTFAAR